MIRPILVLVALVALLGAAHAQWNDNAEDCYLATLPETDITPDLAIHYCSKAIESGELSNENLAETFNNRGRLYDDTGDYGRAISDYDEAIRLEPDNAHAFNNRGVSYRNWGDDDRAIGDYDEAIRLKPDYGPFFSNRGWAYLYKGDYERAIADYDMAIFLKPDDTGAIFGRGYAKFDLNRFTDAVTDLAQAVKHNPKDSYSVIWLYLAQARAGQGGLDNLRANATHVDLDEWPGPVVLMFLSMTTVEAVAAMGSASTTKAEREKRCEATFYVGQYYMLRNQREQAAEYFRATVATGVTHFIEYNSAKSELERLQTSAD